MFFSSNEQLNKLYDLVLEGKVPLVMEQHFSNEKEVIVELPTEGIHDYLGMKSIKVLEAFGEPTRIDPTAYGYHWWIFDNEASYMQFGIKDNYVVSVIGFGEGINVAPFISGNSRTLIEKEVEIKSEFTFKHDGNSFQVELSEDDLKMRPLIRIKNGWAQLNFDTFENTLSSVRYLNTETLLLHKPYTLKYRGKLPQTVTLTRSQWAPIERANELQVLAMTNIIRKRFEVGQLKWHGKVADVAFKHSEDMSVNDYFAHVSPTKGTLKDRLQADAIVFSFAGENIASNYVDALAAVEGWLNSEGHRLAMLNDHYTHLGVGVYKKFYTQNFIKP
jgi:uncharacterized protein YkwD